MVKIKDFDDFCVRTWRLASEDPLKTRWTLKMNTSTGSLGVKVTNNTKTFLYKLQDVDAEFNKVKQFSLSMTKYLTHHDESGKKKSRKRG